MSTGAGNAPHQPSLLSQPASAEPIHAATDTPVRSQRTPWGIIFTRAAQPPSFAGTTASGARPAQHVERPGQPGAPPSGGADDKERRHEESECRQRDADLDAAGSALRCELVTPREFNRPLTERVIEALQPQGAE